MTASAVVPLLLAGAVLLGPGTAVVSARLGALPSSRTPPPAGPAERGDAGTTRSGRLVTLAATIGVGALPMALCGWRTGLWLGPALALAVFLGCRRWLGGRRPVAVRFAGRLWSGRRAEPDPFALAGGWGLLAACLRGGLPVPVAVRLIVPEMPAPARDALRRTAELLALGADAEQAWQPALACPATAELARGARRTARSGAALAAVAEALAVEVRGEAGDLAEARAQRAGVAVTGPLGLCFLPAFLCLGVIPVVIGLATRLMSSW
jgi:hypothetical protein